MRPTVHMRVAVSVARGRETNCSYAGSGIRGVGMTNFMNCIN